MRKYVNPTKAKLTKTSDPISQMHKYATKLNSQTTTNNPNKDTNRLYSLKLTKAKLALSPLDLPLC